MIRGTTPTLTLTIPENVGLDLTQVEEVYVTLRKWEKTITIHGESLSIEPTSVSFHLSQDDSLSFSVGDAEVQLNWLYRSDDGTLCRGATQVRSIGIGKQLLPEVIP